MGDKFRKNSFFPYLKIIKTIATLELVLNSLDRVIKSESIVSNDWGHRPLVSESPGVIVSNSALWTPSQMQSSEFQGICLLIQFLGILLLETTYIISTFTLTYKHDMEKEMATHSSIIAWRIPWTEKPGTESNTTGATQHAQGELWASPQGLSGEESTYHTGDAGDMGSISGVGRSSGEGHSIPLQYSCLENPHGQRSLAGYSPQGQKELDPTEATYQHQHNKLV